jgi:hypothetical protein
MPTIGVATFSPEKAGDQAAVRARAARADDDPVEGEPHLEALLLQLLRAGDVAEAAERVRAAAGNDVGLAAFGGERVGHFLHRLAHVAAGRHDRDRLDAEQAEHEMVAVALRVVAAGDPLLDDEAALQPFLHRRGQGDAAMVRLRRAAGDERVGSLRPARRRTRNSSLRVLLPPGKRPSRSSRLTQTSGPRPPGHCAASSALKRGIGSSGVGQGV